MVTVSDPNLRSTRGGEVLLNLPVNNPRPSSDVNLREVISMSGHSASVSETYLPLLHAVISCKLNKRRICCYLYYRFFIDNLCNQNANEDHLIECV